MNKEMTEEEVEAKILHLLGIYPVISPTMLQAGLGPSCRPALWRPIMQRLVEEGRIEETQENLQTHTGRYNTYTKLRLTRQEQDRASGAIASA